MKAFAATKTAIKRDLTKSLLSQPRKFKTGDAVLVVDTVDLVFKRQLTFQMRSIMATDEDNVEPLHYGDFISLGTLQGVEGFMLAEGAFDDDVSLLASPLSFDQCIFQICGRRQYSAAEELETFEKQERPADDAKEDKREDESVEDESGKKIRAALQSSKNNEFAMNELLEAKQFGTPVCFGDQIQLRHINSSKYVSISMKQLAPLEGDNLKVKLDEEGSSASWLTIVPRDKVESEGDAVLHGARLSLQHGVAFLHVSTLTGEDRLTHEVNGSLDPTVWGFMLFSTYSARQALGDQLRPGDVISLHCPETESYLCVLPRSIRGALTPSVEQERLDVYLADSDPSGVNGNAMFVLESERVDVGGGAHLAEECCRLRHLNTGRYLCIRDGQAETPQGRVDLLGSDLDASPSCWFSSAAAADIKRGGRQRFKAGAQLSTFSEPSILATSSLVRMNPREGHSTTLTDKVGVHLSGTGGRYLVRSEEQRLGSSRFIRLLAADFKALATGLFVHRQPPPLVRQNLFCVGAVQRLDAFIAGLEAERSVNLSGSLPQICSLLGQLLFFVNDLPLDTSLEEFAEREKAGTLRPSRERQLLLQQADVLMSTLTALELLTELSKTASRTAFGWAGSKISSRAHSRTPLGLPQPPGTSPSQRGSGNPGTRNPSRASKVAWEAKDTCSPLVFAKARRAFCPAAFRLLCVCLRGNSAVQTHVAGRFSVLVPYVTEEPGAALCITEMLGTNPELHHSRVGLHELKLFVTKLRECPVSASVLQVLRSLCSCQGRGVDNVQGTLVTLLLEEAPELLFRFHVEEQEGAPRLPWPVSESGGGETSSVAPPYTIIAGGDVLANGMLPLALSWDSPKTDSPMALFGKERVPITELYPLAARRAPPATAKTKKQAATTAFFEAQIRLAGEMCLSRNYSAIHSMYHMFGGGPGGMLVPFGGRTPVPANVARAYGALLSVVAHQELPSPVRAAAVHLLMHMYVDCAPQTRQILPRLLRTRPGQQHPAPPEEALVGVPAAQRAFFFDLQGLVAQHLRVLDGGYGDELTTALVDLLLELMQFGFYGAKEQLQQITEPLVSCIDCRIQKKPPGSAAPASGKELWGATMSKLRRQSSTNAQRRRKSIMQTTTWQGRVLMELESTRFLVLTLIVLLAFIGLAAVGVALGLDGSVEFVVCDAVGTVIFTTELAVRMGLYTKVHSYQRFWRDPFNYLDLLVVLLDVGFLLLDMIAASESSAGGFVKGLRALRGLKLLRLRAFRVVRASNVIRRIGTSTTQARARRAESVFNRYEDTPVEQLSTMVGMVRALGYILELQRDHNLSMLLSGFAEWARGGVPGAGPVAEAYNGARRWGASGSPSGSPSEANRSPVELVREALKQGELMSVRELDLIGVLLDLCMYQDASVVQGALSCLVKLHSMAMHMLEDLREVDLLVSPERIDAKERMRGQLEAVCDLAETFELWDALKSSEDLAKLEEMKSKLELLTEICRRPETALGAAEPYSPVPAVQSMLTKLGAFGIMMTVLGLVDELEDEDAGDGTNDDVKAADGADSDRESTKDSASSHYPPVVEPKADIKQEAVTDILALTCRFLCSWILLNPRNQELAHRELAVFIKLAERAPMVGALSVIAEIFRGNFRLLELFPLHLVTTLVKRDIAAMAELKTTASGPGRELAHFPPPASLLLFRSITHYGERNVAGNQLRIANELTKSQTMASGLLFLGGAPGSEQYELRSKLCAAAEQLQDDEPLPAELVYHGALLDVLTGCGVGTVGINNVEVKLQVRPDMHAPHFQFLFATPAATLSTILVVKVQCTLPCVPTTAYTWSQKSQLSRIG
ncbi:hypothetical protein CYMTET_16298 [Cymbomonas tetramitiformis]|uniref:Uncharacterized protein n=1 Tax=Cymbomonas tetramitiformis TaxID=36881 RepID=A0AAE0L826_9CHLO|nr:hypothetical protein CYMTET_16298 [Cymbomonas tetramitiformis]